MAIAAMELNIPLVHLFGGDLSQGGVDEPVRHAVTKLANIHFASNQQSADRIIKMGEEPWRVHNVGSPVIDLIRQGRFTPPDEVCRKFSLNPGEPILILLQHSVTWQVEQTAQQINATLAALDSLGYQTVAVYPCADPGYETIIRALSTFASRPFVRLHKNLEFADFWGLMNIAGALVGNSSAGVMETASFRIPAVNLGIRQEGRLRADNVLDVDHDPDQIVGAIRTALYDQGFRARVKNCSSPYGDGHAAEKIVRVLNDVPLNDKLIRKLMTY
jgi:UDP-hydrolysing UDP-N-acetyl-D-glucosamine 2-epimerase